MEASHVSALQHKHANIDRLLHQEMIRPIPDDATVQLLKRQKLKIKDAIAQP